MARGSLLQYYSVVAAMALLRWAPTAMRPSSSACAGGRCPAPSSASGHASLQLGARRQLRPCSWLHERCRHHAQAWWRGGERRGGEHRRSRKHRIVRGDAAAAWWMPHAASLGWWAGC
jgi:hypothetical protein